MLYECSVVLGRLASHRLLPTARHLRTRICRQGGRALVVVVPGAALCCLVFGACIAISTFADDLSQNGVGTQRDARMTDGPFATFNGLFHFMVQAGDWKVEIHETTRDATNLPSGEVFVVKRSLGTADSPVVWIRSFREPVDLLDMPDVAAATHRAS